MHGTRAIKIFDWNKTWECCLFSSWLPFCRHGAHCSSLTLQPVRPLSISDRRSLALEHRTLPRPTSITRYVCHTQPSVASRFVCPIQLAKMEKFSGKSEYQFMFWSSQHCRWNITGPPNTQLRISFDAEFDVEKPFGSSWGTWWVHAWNDAVPQTVLYPHLNDQITYRNRKHLQCTWSHHYFGCVKTR